MNKKTDFSFDRILTPEELNFWSTFFDYFPCHHNRYFQSILSSFSKEIIKENTEIEDYYEKVKLFNTKDELVSLIADSTFSKPARENYGKIIKDLDKIFPDSKPIELFLMSLYGGFIQDWTLELKPNGINLLPGDKPLDQITYVPQLAMVCDLMAERIFQLFPKLNLKPIKISGEKILINNKNNTALAISIKNSGLVERFNIQDGNKKVLDFGFTFSTNTIEEKEIYAPLQKEQVKFISLVQKHYLEITLDTKESCYNIKRKI